MPDASHRFPPLLLAAILFAQSGCTGRDPTHPTVDDVVASVAVSPTSPTLVEGDSVQLTATAKSAHGSTVTGKTAVWSTSAAGIATVSDRGVVTGVKQGNVTITATIDGASGNLDLVVGKGVPLVLDATRAANDSIGPAGGAISATASTGVVYTLIVPPNALLRPKRITMTPVKTIRTLPLSGGVLGAVDLQPAGLVFTKPVRLKIAASTTAPAGQHLVGFSFEAQGDSVVPEIVADSGSSATVLLTHFSGGGAVFGSQTDIRTFMSDPSLPGRLPNARFIDSLFVLSLVAPPNFDAELQVLRDWFNDDIIPSIRAAQNDEALAEAIADYHLALDIQVAYGIPANAVLGPEKAAAAAAVAPKLRQAIADENSVCKQQRDIVAAANALFWQTQAADFGVDTPVEQLDRGTVLVNLCIRVAFTRSDYPDPAFASTSGTLDVRAGMQFGADPNIALELFTWTTRITGSTADGTRTGNSDASGGFTLVVTPTGNATLEMAVNMCIFDNQLPYLDVCGTRTITRPFGVTLTGDQQIFSQVGLQALSNVSKIAGSLLISPNPGTPLTSTDLRELSKLSEVTGNVTIVNAPSLQRLDGLHALKRIGGQLQLNGLAALTDMSGLALTDLGGLFVNNATVLAAIEGVSAVTTLNSGLQLSNNPALTSIGGFSSLHSAKELVLANDPLLASLQSMRGVTFATSVSIQDMPAVTTLDDLTGLTASAPLSFLILRNPRLDDFSALSGLTHVHTMTLDSPLLTNLTDLAQLQLIDPDGELRVSGALLTSIALPSLAHAGAIAVVVGEVPRVTTISLPSLQDGGIFVDGACTVARTIAIQLPALAAASNIDVGASVSPASCSVTFAAPSLTSVRTSAVFAAGVSSFSLGPSFTAAGLSFIGTDLTGIGVPVLDVQRLTITGNTRLTGVSGSGGRVTSNLTIVNNENLSTQAATLFANSFSPRGAVVISGNKVP